MAQKRVPVLGWCLLVLLGVFEVQARSAPKFHADVGRFRIPIDDDNLDHKDYDTLDYNLELVFDLAAEYWEDQEAYESVDVEELYVKGLAQTYLSGYQNESQTLIDTANTKVQSALKQALADTTPPGNLTAAEDTLFLDDDDFLGFYLEAIYDMWEQNFYSKLGSLMGVGKNVACSRKINEVLTEKDEWAKAGSSAATTLMALVPTFLAFGNLYVPRSSEAFATSPLVGLGCSLYSLGLPVKSLSALKRGQVKSLAVLGFATLAAIASFATVKTARLGKTQVSSDDESEEDIKSPTLSELQGWSSLKKSGGIEDDARHIFYDIKQAVEEWHKRYHWWNAPAYIVVVLQAVMFALAIAPLLVNVGAPRFLLSCHVNWTGKYLGISAAANAVLRFVMWQAGHHEQVKIYALSQRAKQKLRDLVKQNNGPVSNMEDEVPPLYPPVLTRIRAFIDPVYPGLFVRLGWKDDTSSSYAAHTTSKTKKRWINSVKGASRRQIDRLSWATKNLRQVVQGGFHSQPREAARRWRPLVVLVHLSAEGRNFLMTLLTGFFEAALLVILTFFFAAQWGGNLVITAVAMGLLLVFITLGRALGLLYVYLSSRVWGLHVLDCATQDEVLGSLRILCSMKDVIVVVNGASYFDGYRLNDMADYEMWKSEYDKGVYDDDAKSSNAGKPRGGSGTKAGQSNESIHAGAGAGTDAKTRSSVARSSTEGHINRPAKGPAVAVASTASVSTHGLPPSPGNAPEHMV